VKSRPVFLIPAAFVFFGLADASHASSRCARLLAATVEIPEAYLGQFHPDLLRAFAGSEALCGPTCLQNANRLAKFVEGGNAGTAKTAIEETVDRIETLRRIAPRSDPYDPKTAGLSFEMILKGLAASGDGLEKLRFVAKSEDVLPVRDARRLETFFKRNPNFERRSGRIQSRDMRSPRVDFFILGFVELNADRQPGEFIHAVLGAYDETTDTMRIHDPYFPGETSVWSFGAAAGGYGFKLERRSGSSANGVEEVVVHDYVGFVLPDRR
jgi:hypothetical protein